MVCLIAAPTTFPIELGTLGEVEIAAPTQAVINVAVVLVVAV
jgi:hypothetical protein